MPFPSDGILQFIPPKHRHHRLLSPDLMPREVPIREPEMPEPIEDTIDLRPYCDLLGRTNLDELANILRRLSYGEMVEFASGIKHDPGAIYRWAKGHETR